MRWTLLVLAVLLATGPVVGESLDGLGKTFVEAMNRHDEATVKGLYLEGCWQQSDWGQDDGEHFFNWTRTSEMKPHLELLDVESKGDRAVMKIARTFRTTEFKDPGDELSFCLVESSGEWKIQGTIGGPKATRAWLDGKLPRSLTVTELPSIPELVATGQRFESVLAAQRKALLETGSLADEEFEKAFSTLLADGTDFGLALTLTDALLLDDVRVISSHYLPEVKRGLLILEGTYVESIDWGPLFAGEVGERYRLPLYLAHGDEGWSLKFAGLIDGTIHMSHLADMEE
ncbi:MAG: hypothetical protein WC314_09015 [Vulcanimicrobiota bacterium]